MNEIVRRRPGRWRKPALSLPKGPATVAVDATGLAQAAVSSYFIRRVEHFGQKQRTWKHRLKWLAAVNAGGTSGYSNEGNYILDSGTELRYS
jgi:hypothetical protein